MKYYNAMHVKVNDCEVNPSDSEGENQRIFLDTKENVCGEISLVTKQFIRFFKRHCNT